MSSIAAKPKVGEVWRQANVDLSSRLYLVLGRHVHRHSLDDTHVDFEQHVLLDLQTGKQRRVNVRQLNSANGWGRWRHRRPEGQAKRTKIK